MRSTRARYLSWNMFFFLLIVATCQTIVNKANAKSVYISPGESYMIKTQEEIDTVFISSAAIADYELVSKNSVVVYAKSEGAAEIMLFDDKHQLITKKTVLVNKVINAANKRVLIEYPESNIDIDKIGDSYILTGLVESEEAKDTIATIVGEAIGSQKEKPSEGQYLSTPDYSHIINKLKLPQANQVNVKLTIAEVTKDFTENVGVDWSTLGDAIGSFQFVKFNAKGISTLVHAINDDSIARILAEPNLSVLSGESASFLVGGEIPIASSTENSQSVTYKEFGIKLGIGAKVNEKKRIRILLNEEVSSIGKSFSMEGGNSYPSLKTRKAATTLELGDGESFILGGLISNTERESLKKIPFIGDIPILGALFRNAQTEQSQTELVVIATVNLVKPVSRKEVELPDFMHTSTLERLFNFTHIMEIKREKMAKEFLSKGGFIK
ncbi:pilus assembly protein N-terminal domain-containing protein [Yersinia sp. Marseille-Q3913]|uniref:type II and III secretion system protein family protein n=1 Tax=Yersinia sp. Marseille-Q3913 TaxID=2830769 RepID=UPI001BAE9BD9|nr:pilus assembly protein N-terminal domain-containing protein [Yersinia sp. Marseille-Q3913]MBS0054003.1 pilus assembly protein N-terminal domain-containing protein [Yersinia sp. Marseille-Q3913]